jgi:hypothetical protein
MQQAAAKANESADRMSRAGQSMELTHNLLLVATGLLTAALVSAFWLWLAPADGGESSGCSVGSRVPAARDRSLEAVKAQIGAMGAERYEVVIVNAKTGRQTRREWNASELVKNVPWLIRMNAQGGDIYLRPLDGPELLLVDALSAEAVKGMHRQELAPASDYRNKPRTISGVDQDV